MSIFRAKKNNFHDTMILKINKVYSKMTKKTLMSQTITYPFQTLMSIFLAKKHFHDIMILKTNEIYNKIT